jgi:acetyl-CoA C-acetyltransferase
MIAATVIQKLLKKTGVPGADIEDVILGDTNQAGEDFTCMTAKWTT